MVWVAVDKDGTELMFGGRPDRRKDSWFCYSSVDLLNLPNGSIKKLIGRKLTWKDEPVELIEKPKEDKKLREIKFRAKVIYHPSILNNDKATGEWVTEIYT